MHVEPEIPRKVRRSVAVTTIVGSLLGVVVNTAPCLQLLAFANSVAPVAAAEWVPPGQIDTLDVDEAIKELKSSNPLARRKAVAALGKTTDSRLVDPLINALKDEDAAVRMAAASALAGGIGGKRGVEAVAAVARGVPWRAPTRQTEAARALATSGNPDALEALIAVLNTGHLDNQIIAAQALGLSKDKRAVEALTAIVDRIKPNTVGSVLPSKQYEKRQLRVEALQSLQMIAGLPEPREALLAAPANCAATMRAEDIPKVWQERQMPGVRDALITCLQSVSGHNKATKMGKTPQALFGEARFRALAELFLNSGDDSLNAVAYVWADRNGFKVVRVTKAGTTGWITEAPAPEPSSKSKRK
jgi:HEAT repeats